MNPKNKKVFLIIWFLIVFLAAGNIAEALARTHSITIHSDAGVADADSQIPMENHTATAPHGEESDATASEDPIRVHEGDADAQDPSHIYHSDDQAETAALIERYFPHEAWDKAKDIAWCESRWNSQAHNPNSNTGDDSYGVFQINLHGNLKHSRPAPEKLLNKEFNIQYAAQMFERSGWRPWSCDRKIKGGEHKQLVRAD